MSQLTFLVQAPGKTISFWILGVVTNMSAWSLTSLKTWTSQTGLPIACLTILAISVAYLTLWDIWPSSWYCHTSRTPNKRYFWQIYSDSSPPLPLTSNSTPLKEAAVWAKMTNKPFRIRRYKKTICLYWSCLRRLSVRWTWSRRWISSPIISFAAFKSVRSSTSC